MKYFLLTSDSDPKITGQFPQVISQCGPADVFAPNHISRINKDGPLPVKPNVDCFKLEHRAKPSDFINAVQLNWEFGQIVSTNLFTLLSDFNCCEMDVFDTIVRKKEKDRPYKFLHLLYTHNEFVNFEKSEFIIQGNGDSDRADIKIKDNEDWLGLRQGIHEENHPYRKLVAGKYVSMGSRKLIVNLENCHLDLFRVFCVFSGLLVSERLKTALQAAQITGATFWPVLDNDLVASKRNWLDNMGKIRY